MLENFKILKILDIAMKMWNTTTCYCISGRNKDSLHNVEFLKETFLIINSIKFTKELRKPFVCYSLRILGFVV